ncbi:cyclic peptide export ABC transporter [Chamaesiphon minutus]|uniref:Cyclic peptide transporter n=1 Tax=Chamaesiphon minutus (strain ATCC 27169 / PCC 6605) TaxID=1173020 RepID=K9UAC5_CHAP6|nr:cyclic peptide export ABC transporter [Chamaesiphon minutus]AFY92072.1 cyclic peptide transporter [Chamaesiphon minutus PCC 6605]
MNLIEFLLKAAWKSVVAAAITGSISGMGSAAAIALINRSISQITPQHPQAPPELLWGFLGLVTVVLVTNLISQFLLVQLAQDAIYKLRLRISGWILASPLQHLEELGTNRLLTTLTEDIQSISSAVFSVPTLCVNAAIVVASFAYLGWLSIGVLLGTLTFMALSIALVQLLINQAVRLFTEAREENDALMKHFQAITDGIKELKLHSQRREEFLQEDLQTTAANLRNYRIGSQRAISLSGGIGELSFFILLGLLVYGLPHVQTVSSELLSGYVLTISYLMRPIGNTLAILPNLSQAGVALRKIDTLGLSLASRAEMQARTTTSSARFKQIEIRQATHIYQLAGEEKTFTLGPIDLTIEPGELIFIVGGNGSGKSTLAKLITGLYAPDSGEVRLDGTVVDDLHRELYRQLFSTVFADFYLFDRFVGLQLDDGDAQAKMYLEKLQLTHKVAIENGKLSTTALSQGQRKRLALLTAYLEDRPIYLFDEWAADQDPFFREIFYQQLLPELKQRGKAILVISHDDRYFHLADRLLKLDYGKIVRE